MEQQGFKLLEEIDRERDELQSTPMIAIFYIMGGKL